LIRKCTTVFDTEIIANTSVTSIYK